MQALAMKRRFACEFSPYRIIRYVLLWTTLNCSVIALAQTSNAPQTNATAVLQQIWTAFSGSNAISQVQLTANATWYAGSLVDSGTATLTANSSGAAQMQLALAQKGAWTESQTAFGIGMTCQWSGANAVAYTGDFLNCLKPAVWFLPSLSLQPPSIPTGVGVADLGVGAVGPGSYRHLQSQAVLQAMPSYLLSASMTSSTTDIGFDPNTLLPAVLLWQVHPDNGIQIDIPVQILYTNYQKVNGVVIPFTIQRYINGSLQLELQITSVQFS